MVSAVGDKLRKKEEAGLVTELHGLMDDQVAAALARKKGEILDAQVMRSLNRMSPMIPGFRQAEPAAPAIEGLKPHADLVNRITDSARATSRFLDHLGVPKVKKPPKGDQTMPL